MTPTQRAAMEQALEALERVDDPDGHWPATLRSMRHTAKTALRSALSDASRVDGNAVEPVVKVSDVLMLWRLFHSGKMTPNSKKGWESALEAFSIDMGSCVDQTPKPTQSATHRKAIDDCTTNWAAHVIREWRKEQQAVLGINALVPQPAQKVEPMTDDEANTLIAKVFAACGPLTSYIEIIRETERMHGIK